VKRIVGLPGERVQIRSPAVWINGKPLTPPHEQQFGPAPGQDWGDSDEFLLGPGEYFVLGDNSAVSIDSRVWRPAGISRSLLVGRPILPGMGSGRQPTE
jgi:signal peptidase I